MAKKIGWLGVVAVVAVVGGISNALKPSTPPLTPAEQAAADSAKAKRKALNDLRRRQKATIEAGKAAVLTRLKDPESARFGDVWAGGDSALVFCGNVNSKNSFGGYTGERFFWGVGTDAAFESDLKSQDASTRQFLKKIRVVCDTTVTIK